MFGLSEDNTTMLRYACPCIHIRKRHCFMHHCFHLLLGICYHGAPADVIPRSTWQCCTCIRVDVHRPARLRLPMHGPHACQCSGLPRELKMKMNSQITLHGACRCQYVFCFHFDSVPACVEHYLHDDSACQCADMHSSVMILSFVP